MQGSRDAVDAELPERQIWRGGKTTHSLRWIVVVAALCLAGSSAVAATFYILTLRAEHWVEHSHDVTTLARRAMALAVDRETGLRGYLITRDSRSLEPEVAARAVLPRVLDSLVALTADNPVQTARAQDLRSAVAQWDREFAAPVLAGSASSSVNLAGKSLFDAVRGHAADFVEREETLYEERRVNNARMRTVAASAFVLESVIFAAIFFLAYARASRQGVELSQQYQQLADQAVEFEMQSAELQEQAMQLTISSALTGAIVQASPVSIIALDRDLSVTTWNAGAEQLFGWTAAEIIGQQHPIIPDGKWEDFRAMRDRLVANGRISEERHERVRKDGSTVTVSISGAALLDARGENVGVVIIASDLTERERLETELRQAQRMEAIGQLAGGVAHDFNNLLTVILSYSQMHFAEAAAGSALASGLREISDAASRAAGLTRQLLTFSQRQLLAPNELSLNEVLHEITPMLGRQLGPSVKLDVQLGDGLWSCFADRGQIVQVVVNLATNAREAMPGGGTLAIETRNTIVNDVAEHAEPGIPLGSYVTLHVRDEGTGIDNAILSHIFEPFFTTKPAGEGTGLGLATVYGIVRQSEGFIQVASVLGKGTEFVVYLPVAPHVAAHDTLPSATPPGGTVPIEERGGTIMVVEDLPAIRMLSRTILERSGNKVIEAEHGEAALRLLAAAGGTIDLVISDIEMPQMGGLELMRRLGELYPQIPIMLVSGYSEELLLRRGVLSSRVAFLEKPYTPRALLDAVAEVRRRARHAKMPTPLAARPLVAIVDDTELNRELAGALLEDSCAILSLPGGHSTIDDLAARVPALILLDIDMPELNGFEVLARIRQNSTLRRTPVIAFTARSTLVDRKQFEAAGFDGYIGKPIADFEAFRVAVDGCVKGPRHADDASAVSPAQLLTTPL